MEKVRIGNDIQVKYTVLRDGLPESFAGATNIAVEVKNEAYGKVIPSTFSIVDNVVNVVLDAKDCTLCGKHRVTLSYNRGNNITIDALAFELVQFTSQTGGTEIVGVEIVTLNISGDSGVGGTKGVKGDNGDKGDQGIQGPEGPAGPEGPQGIQGPKGDQGLQGEPGIPGPKGDPGQKGDPGENGLPGPKGDPGTPGEKGDPGDIGPQGKPLIVLENGNYANWNEATGTYVDSGVLAAATVNIEDVPVTFTEAALRENILSEETIPTIFGKIKKWFSSLKALAFKDKVDYTTDIDNLPTIPSKTTDLTNDSSFITSAVSDLVNYYVKTDTYTKAEVQSLIGSVSSLRIESVATLPTTGESNVIYLIPRDPVDTNNVKLEYIWIGSWEEIGSTEVDLTGYALTTYVDTALSGKANSSHAHVTSDINLSSTARFVTDAEKTTWNGKQDALSGDVSGHYHSADSNRANHTGTQTSNTISDFAETVRTTVLTGLSLLTNSAIAATDSVLTALGKLQKQITDHFNATNPHGITKTTVGLGSVDNTADSAKNVLSATKLTTARNINGVSFNGTQDITITDGTKEPTIAAGTTSQYYRGDKTWQTLNKTAVGLGNVDNTTDANKPISSATQTALNGKAASSHTHAPSDLSSPVTIAKGGTGLNALGTAGQFLQVNSAANAMEWVTPRDKGANTVSTLASLPVTKRLVVATVTAVTTLSLANMEIGDELHVIVYNNSSTAKTQPLPNTGAFLSLSGTSISIPAYGYIEINILCRAVNNYIIRAL